MATKGVKELFGDVLIDSELRDRLVTNTENTIREGQYKLDDDEIAMIKQIVSTENINDLSIEELDERIALCGGGGPSGACSGCGVRGG